MAVYPGKSGIGDTDFWWHVSYGRWMLENKTLPSVDTFSWTFTGTPYQLTQWAGELVMGWAYLAGGFNGTLYLGLFVSGITIFASWKAAERYVHPAVAVTLAVLVNSIHIITPMRPQLFSFMFVAISMYLITGYLAKRRSYFLLPMLPMLALWSNFHGGFIVGLILLGILAVGLTAEHFLGARATAKDCVVAWLVLFAASAAACINPYGIGAITTVLMIGSLQSSALIAEWQPVVLTSSVGAFYLNAAIPLIGARLLGARLRVTELLLCTFLLVFGLLANRQIAIMAAGMSPIIALAIAQTAAYQKMIIQFGDPNRRWRHGAVMLALFALWFPINSMGMHKAASDRSREPIEATEFLLKNGFKRVVNDPLEGSYLIWKKVPVFIDGRMDLYLDPFFFESLLAFRGHGSWREIINRTQPDSMLLRNEVALREVAIASGEWRTVFSDENYSVLIPAKDKVALPTVAPVNNRFVDDEGKVIRAYRP